MNYNENENRFQDGLIVVTEDGSKFLYGIVDNGTDMCKMYFDYLDLQFSR